VAPDDDGDAVGKLVVGAEVLGATDGAVGEVDGASDGAVLAGDADGAVLAGDADGVVLAGDADGVEVDGASDGTGVDGAAEGDRDEHVTSTTALTAPVKPSTPLTSMMNVLLGVDAILLSRSVSAVESSGSGSVSTATTTTVTPSARTISASAASFSRKPPKAPNPVSKPVVTTTSTRLAAPCVRKPAVSSIKTFRMWSRPPLTLVVKP